MTALRSALFAAASLAAVVSSSSAFAYERWVNVVNNASTAIYSINISHIDTADWGPDLLGEYTIPVGYESVVEPAWNDGYCRFDVLITYDTGATLTLWDVNLCEATDIVAYDASADVYFI